MERERRYSAQSRLKEIGVEGQRRLKEKTVLIVGCGALGSVAAMYLAGAGVGHLIIADFDTVDISNLHRQVFFSEDDTSKSKVDIIKDRIFKLNPDVEVRIIKQLVTGKILENLEKDVDAIVDAADNPDTTFMIDRFCTDNGIPWTTAGVRGWEAQIFTFKPYSTSYSEIISQESLEGDIMPCSLEGILGPVAGMAAAIQCSEVIKLLLDIGNSLADSLLTINLKDNSFLRLELWDENNAGDNDRH